MVTTHFKSHCIISNVIFCTLKMIRIRATIRTAAANTMMV